MIELFKRYKENDLYAKEINTYNAYKDVGYYYITMGNLHIGRAGAELSNTDFSENYVLRLHPSYLLDGKDPNDKLGETTYIIYKYNELVQILQDLAKYK